MLSEAEGTWTMAEKGFISNVHTDAENIKHLLSSYSSQFFYIFGKYTPRLLFAFRKQNVPFPPAGDPLLCIPISVVVVMLMSRCATLALSSSLFPLYIRVYSRWSLMILLRYEIKGWTQKLKFKKIEKKLKFKMA